MGAGRREEVKSLSKIFLEIAAHRRSFDALCRMLYRFRFNFCSFSGASKNLETEEERRSEDKLVAIMSVQLLALPLIS